MECCEKKTVFLIEDDDLMRGTICAILQTDEVEVRSFADPRTFLEEHDATGPYCIVTDFRMPGMLGMDLVRECRRRGVSGPIIMTSGYADVDLVVEAFHCGVYDFLKKPFSNNALITSVHGALEESGGQIVAMRRSELVKRELSRLSAQERMIVDHLIRGGTSKEIARDANMNYRTVERHRQNILKKFECKNTVEFASTFLACEMQAHPNGGKSQATRRREPDDLDDAGPAPVRRGTIGNRTSF